jgi:multimeric flavodoxin WrbA
VKDFSDFLIEERIKNKNANIRILAIQGSARNENCCPDKNSKSYKLLKNAIKDRDGVFFDFLDLSVKCDGNIVQPCKACISTAGGYHCHWHCDCYSKKGKVKDLMSEENVYERLEKCDGFVVFSPINWDAPSSVVKNFFDRLVCCNLTLTTEDAKKVLGEDNLKNSEATRSLAKSGKYNHLLKNHLEGKFAAFFMQGDNGADDYKNLNKPDSYIKYSNGKKLKSDPVSSIEPIIKQLVYSGIYVESNCVDGLISGFGTDYATNDDKLEKDLYNKSRKVVDNLINSILNYKNKNM